MGDTFRKLAIYFHRQPAYWQVSSKWNSKNEIAWGWYPLSFEGFLDSGLFDSFDPDGLPLRRFRAEGVSVHLFSKMFAYALGHWERYLRTGESRDAQALILVADYVLRNADCSDGGCALRMERPGKGHSGEISAMDQGMAMSVLGRAFRASRDLEYLNAAERCLQAFQKSVEDDGVVSRFSAIESIWFEEHTLYPIRHILNGMVFALWGLWELVRFAGDSRAEALFSQGLSSLEKALGLYDTGFWSRYWVAEDERHYMASMKYHNLHICQLEVLGLMTGSDSFRSRGARFRSYLGSASCRCRAALGLAVGKLAALSRRE